MARPLPMEFAGAPYHVIVRSSERRPVFRDDEDRSDYLERLARYGEKFGFRLLAYRLMDNHVHLAVETRRCRYERSWRVFSPPTRITS
jgi:putative transposase